MSSWQELAERVVQECAQDLQIGRQISLKFVKYLKKPSNAWGAAIKVPIDRVPKKWEIRVETQWLDQLYEKDPEFCKAVLRFILAHELGHLSDPRLGDTNVSLQEKERYADAKATQIRGYVA